MSKSMILNNAETSSEIFYATNGFGMFKCFKISTVFSIICCVYKNIHGIEFQNLTLECRTLGQYFSKFCSKNLKVKDNCVANGTRLLHILMLQNGLSRCH